MKRVPVTLLLATTLLAVRLALAGRPVLLTGRTLVLVLGVAGAVDLLLALRRGVVPTGTLAVLVLLAGLYPAAGRMAIIFRASLDQVTDALTRSARIVRLNLAGGPGRYRLSSSGTSATLVVSGRFRGLHPLTFGGDLASRKTKLYRRVVAKQFGGLIPILVRVRT